MKAIRVSEFGKPDVLKMQEIERPKTKADEVLIKVAFAAVLPIDTKIRQGKVMKKKFPYTPGIAVSGTIVEVGTAVSGFEVGDPVFGRTKGGAYQEFARIPQSQLNHKPKLLTFAKAAAIIAGAETAWKALFTQGKLQSGERVLIQGAAGGVGHIAVQLAKWKEAEVIGTASSKNQDFLRELGVDQAIDYQTESFETAMIEKADLVVDLIGGKVQERSLHVLKQGGRLVSLVENAASEEAKAMGIDLIYSQESPTLEDLDKLAELMAAGIVKTVIESVYDFTEEQVQAATMKCETGHGQGRILLRIAED